MGNLRLLPQEIWRDIPGYEGFYQASTSGKIKSIVRDTNHRFGIAVRKSIILKQHLSQKGYLKVKLQMNGKIRTRCVHTLVAMTFIPNPLNLIEVNHKKGNRKDNRVSELEWCTTKANQQHKIKYLFNRERYKKAMNSPQRLEKLSAKFKRGGNPFAKKVINTSTGEVFGCVGDAADACGYTYNQLKQWLNGRRKNRSTLKYL
jgi:hypothetical protein